ncbi:hypothetical protein AL755_08405 [Arthrobacter sp. ERGS1:01]|nr:hypothetical protein AL755_08405 [Arthrobacter sp. ERGS1:01]
MRLLRQFSLDSREWEDTVTKWKLEPILLEVMGDLAEILGTQETRLCTGAISHDINEWDEAGKPRLLWDEAPVREKAPWFPNSYEAIVVTEKLIVQTWGCISGSLDAVHPEATQTYAIKNLGRVSKLAGPGTIRSDGTTAAHHNIAISFTDGSSVELPVGHEALTASGIEKMTGLVASFYQKLSD